MNASFLSKVSQILEEHYTDEAFSVEELAREAGLSRSMLHRKLKTQTGKSASETICEFRLNKARQFFESEDSTISEIAYRVGFNDPSYFARVFRKQFGLSPGEYRKKHSSVPAGEDKLNTLPPVAGRRQLIWLIAAGIAVALIASLLVLRSENQPSLAVLPLRNLTGSPENDYLVAGFHDALVGELARISSIRVIGTTSTLVFKDSALTLPKMARMLGARSVLEGSVTGSGDSLKLIIQVIDVFPKERHLFAGEYARPMSEAVNIQKQVARDVASHIRIRLQPVEEEQLGRREPVNPQTYKSFLRAMYYMNLGTEESMLRALDTLAGAIHRDPADPYAHGGFALGKAIYGHGANIARVYFNSAVASAEKALIIDPDNPMAHLALGMIYLYQHWDWTKADKAFRRCLELQPNSEIAHAHYAWYHVVYEDYEAASYHARMSVELNPLSATFKSWYAWILYLAGDYDLAGQQALESLEIEDENYWANLVMGWVHLQNGNFDKALEYHERLPGEAHHWAFFKARTYMLTGHEENTRALWRGMTGDSVYWVNPYFEGIIAGILGNSSESRRLLEEALSNKYYPSSYIHTFPEWEFIRGYPWSDSLLMYLNL